jgi:hypothetical protein
MHSGCANVCEPPCATGAGHLCACYKTRNVALVVMINAVNTIVLFGMLGFLTR